MTTRRLVLGAAALLALAWSGSGAAQAPPAVPLFVPAPADAPGPAASARARPDIVRERTTAVAAAALNANRLVLNLFPGVSLRAEMERREVSRDGSVSWSGHVPGQPLSSVTFVQLGNVLQGSVRLLGAAFSIEPVGQGALHVIRELDLSQLGSELDPLAPPGGAGDATDAALSTADDPTVIDVLVVYTAAARAAAGGTDAAIQARIMLGVAETNVAFTKSRVLSQLRLVGTELVPYVESSTDLTIDLERLTHPDDGHMDAVHARREALGADLVQLVVGSITNGCGVAWLMQSLSADFAPLAFSVSAYPCISPNYTFGHELAHSMGSTHAPDDPSTQPVFPYSYGYKHPGGLFRTMMAYVTGCDCPRVLQFSSPVTYFQGASTGTPSQNNALSLNNTRAVVASFRLSPDLPGPPGNVSVSTAGTTANFSWTAPTTGLAPTTYVIEAGSAPGLANLATLDTGGSATSFSVSGVPAGRYFVRVRARNSAGTGAPSADASLVMTSADACTMPPGPPVQLAPVVSGSHVLLSWNAPTTGDPVGSYVVAAGSAPGSSNLATFDTGSAATTLATMAPNGTYFVRIGARNACGIGAASNEVSFTAGPHLPGAPSGLNAVVAPTRVVTLQWSPPASGGMPTSYTVEAGSASGLSNLAVLPMANASTTLAVTAPPGTYFVRVRATNGAGAGAPSNEVTVEVP